MLILANGDTLLDRLVRQGIASPEDIDEARAIYTMEDFFTYLDTQRNTDGVYVYDRIHHHITRVYELNNNIGQRRLAYASASNLVRFIGRVAQHHVWYATPPAGAKAD